jgi:RNA polymerase sigma-70 factor (ECF subfamily)
MDTQFARPAEGSGPSPTDEAVRLQRARAGDRDAFQQLLLGHKAHVFTLALRLTGQRADAEDLAQDVFEQLHAALPKISSPAHLRHWLLRTVSHRAIDRLRQGARQGQAVSLEALTGSPQDQAPAAAEDPLAAAHLHRLLLRLQPDARAVLLLRYQEDLDTVEIAAVLEMPVNTVKSHLRRSIEWLRAEFPGEHHGS